MLLTLDINKKAEQIIEQANDISLKLQIGEFDALCEKITDFILILEGYNYHISELSKPEIAALSLQVQKVIAQFIEIDDNLYQANYHNNEKLKELFQYALKCLYKLKSILHISCTSGIPIAPTGKEIKNGLAAVSRAAALHNISKNLH